MNTQATKITNIDPITYTDEPGTVTLHQIVELNGEIYYLAHRTIDGGDRNVLVLHNAPRKNLTGPLTPFDQLNYRSFNGRYAQLNWRSERAPCPIPFDADALLALTADQPDRRVIA